MRERSRHNRRTDEKDAEGGEEALGFRLNHDLRIETFLEGLTASEAEVEHSRPHDVGADRLGRIAMRTAGKGYLGVGHWGNFAVTIS